MSPPSNAANIGNSAGSMGAVTVNWPGLYLEQQFGSEHW